MKPIIKAAIQSGLPPLALLFDDPSRTGKYTRWDTKLIKAYYINEAFEINGHPIHVEESKNIIWEAKRKTLRSAEVVEREQERLQESKSKNFGVRIVAVPKLKHGAKWPTRKEWIEAQQAPERDYAAERAAQRLRDQEERARIKLEAMNAAEQEEG